MRLHRAGVNSNAWRLIDDLGSHIVSTVRVQGAMSDSWVDDDFLAQGRVLSPLLLNVLMNGVAPRVRKVCKGVALGPENDAPHISILMYADDIVILAETPSELQAAFNAVSEWGRQSRFGFGIGLKKSAVLCFHPPRSLPAPFVLSGTELPYVDEYKYWGVVLDKKLMFAAHARHLVQRGEARMAQRLALGIRERLPL